MRPGASARAYPRGVRIPGCAPLALVCALLVGCQAAESVTPASSASAASVATASQGVPSPGDPGPSRAIAVGENTLRIPHDATVTELPDGTARVVIQVVAEASPRFTVEGGGFALVSGRVRFDDGALLSRPVADADDGSSSNVAFVADTPGFTVRPVEEAGTLTFLAGSRLVEASRWESESRILISPTSLARDLTPGDILAGSELAPAVMAQVVAQHPGRAPDLGTDTVLNQLACHMIGARNKETWNLELDRADKGLAGFIGSRCN